MNCSLFPGYLHERYVQIIRFSRSKTEQPASAPSLMSADVCCWYCRLSMTLRAYFKQGLILCSAKISQQGLLSLDYWQQKLVTVHFRQLRFGITIISLPVEWFFHQLQWKITNWWATIGINYRIFLKPSLSPVQPLKILRIGSLKRTSHQSVRIHPKMWKKA